MAVIQGEQAIIKLAQYLKDRENPDDPGPFAEISDELQDVWVKIRGFVEKTGKACKGKVTFTIDLKGYRTTGKEVGVEVLTGVTTKAPAKPRRGAMLYLDHEGSAHTAPVQDELPLFTGPKAVEGGKNDNTKADKTAKKGTI